ncbi:MAG: hypothetical protein K9J18_03715, partial [Crocinitomicaceae bacterium]|nr:hypothetical protein [Crocinitomicaceae bacterium]
MLTKLFNAKISLTPNSRQNALSKMVLRVTMMCGLLVPSLSGLMAQVTVQSTSGVASANYATVSAAFAAINSGTHQGAVTILVTGNTAEPGAPVALLKSASPSNYSSVYLRPQGGNWTIAGTITANRGIIELNGADNVTIDGDDPNTAGARNLTIGFASTAATATACVRVSSNSTTGTDGADNNTVKNCIITGSRGSAGWTTATYGINMSNYSTTLLSTGGYSSLNAKFENNLITRVYHGIWAVGSSATYPNKNLIVRNNVLGDNTLAGNIGQRGINFSYTSTGAADGNALIVGNEIMGGDPGTVGYSATVAGIEVGTVNYGAIIESNYIHDIKQPSTSGYGAIGISVTGSTNNTLLIIRNNIIRDMVASKYTSSATSSFTQHGVYFSAGATGVKLDNNTIVLSVAPTTGSTAAYSANCVYATTSVVFSSFRNNILVNSLNSTGAIGFYCGATGNISTANVNRNNYYVPTGHVGYYSAANRTTLGAWQTATAKDINSLNLNPVFTSATDLHLNYGTIATQLESGGEIISDYNVDYDNQARPGPTGSVNGGGTSYDIGADEFDGAPLTAVNLTAVTNVTGPACAPSANIVNATVIPGSLAITSVTLNYSINGTVQPGISMTSAGGNTWAATIPDASTIINATTGLAYPSNATITWSVTTIDPLATITLAGTSYQNDITLGMTAFANASAAAVCSGQPATLTATVSNLASTVAPTNYATPAVSSPTFNEDISSVVISQGATTILSNSTLLHDLSGDIGTATGTAGGYANFTGFGPYSLTAGQSYNFSLSSVTSGTSYANALAIFIDYNRNGLFNDAGEMVYTSAATTTGPHTETGSFTIPYTAFNGLTRMRVVSNEGLITAATVPYYGEYEEYAINLSSATNGGGTTLPIISAVTWTNLNGDVVGNTNNAVINPLITDNYTPTVLIQGCPISVSNTVTVTTNPLPATPTGLSSTQCGPLVPTASVVSNSGATSPLFTWQQNNYISTFNTGAAGVVTETLYGNASYLNGAVQLTPNTTSNIGAMMIPANGAQGTDYSISFSLKTSLAAQSGADGMSYCFGDDATWPLTLNAEYGSGSKLHVSFDSYGTSGGNIAGIRVIYGASTNTPGEVVGANGVLAYSNNVSWAGTANNVPVVITISNGNLTLTVNGTAIFTNLALPASFVSANKSNWKHLFAARTGGVSMVHTIDNVTITPALAGVASVATTYPNLVNNTTTFYVTETSNGCVSQAVPVTVTVTTPPAVTIVGTTGICIGQGTTLTATSLDTLYSYVWSTGDSTASINVTPTTTTTYSLTAIDNDTLSSNYTCINSASVTVTVNPLPLVSVLPNTSTVCVGASQTLTMAVGGPQVMPANYCTGSPSTSTFGDEQIFGVSFGSMTNIQTETCTTNYTNYTSSLAPVNVITGSPYAFSVITDECDGSTYFSSGLSIYIDYNRDGDFDDAGEQAYTTTTTTLSPNTRTGSITIPATATPGLTRMRVVVQESVASPAACASFSYGEMEDYAINIQSYTIPATAQTSWSSGETTSSISAAPTATSTYTVTYTDVNGCVNTANATVNLTTLTAFDGIVTNPTCYGANGSIQVVASGGSTPYTYSIDGVNYVTSSTIAAPAGSYTVYVKDASGCVASHSGVVVNQPTQVQITNALGTNPICNGYTNGQLSFDANGGTGLLTATVNSASATSPVTNLAAGSYTIVVTDTNSCSATTTVVLNDPAIPTLSIANNGPVCNGAMVTITPTTGFATYAWTGPNNYTSSLETPQVSVGGSYNLTAVDANGCSSSAVNDVVVNPILPVSVSLSTSPATSVCVGTDMTITANAINPGVNPVYVWTLDGVAQTSTTNTLQFVSSSTTVVSVELTSSETCTSGNPAVASETITVTGAINATVALSSSNTAPCFGDVLTYTTNIVGGGTAPTFEFFVNNVSVQNGALSTYTYAPINGDVVSVVMTSSFACAIGSPASSNAITQLVNALPAAPVLTSTAMAVCAPSTIEVSADVTTGLNWSNNSTASSVIVSNVGPQLLTATYTDANGCISAPALPIVVTIYPQNITSITSTNNANLCPGSPVTLTSTTASNNVWSTGDVTSTISASTAGQYTLTNVDANGCMSVSDVTVIEQPAPVVNVVSNCSVLLNGNSITFDAAASIASGNIATYAWQSGATVVSSTASLTTSTGGVYILNVTSDQGCSTLTPVLADITSPLAGIYTIGGTASCSNFTSFANAFAAINTRGVAGNVTFEVAAGYTETAPVGGLTMSQCNLAANLLSGPSQTISFVKTGSGANPKISASVGTLAGSSNTYTDVIVKIIGADNVTFNGIDLFDGNALGNSMMETGLGIYKCGTLNGSNDVVYTNGTITLNRANTTAIGVRVSNTNGANATSLVYNGPAVQQDVQKFRNKVSVTNNTITNTYGAVYFDAATATTSTGTISTNDTLNVVSGNTITNFGGAATTVYAVRFANNRGIQILNNNINTLGAGHTTTVYAIDGGSGPHGAITGNTISVNAPSTFYGIYWASSGTNNAASISNNVISNSVISAATSTYYGIYCGLSGANNNIAINNNTVSGITTTATRTSGGVYGIYAYSGFMNVSVSGNTFTNNNVGGTTGSTYAMYYYAYGQTAGTAANINNNNITNNTFNGTGTVYGLYLGGYTATGLANGSVTFNANNNAITGNTKTGVGSFLGINSLMYNAAFNPSMSNNNISNNVINGGAGACTFNAIDMSNTSTTYGASWNISNNTITNNSIVSVTGTNSAAMRGIYYQNALGGLTITMSNNTISNLSIAGTATGTQEIAGIYATSAGTNTMNISSNVVTNLNHSGSGNATAYGVFTGAASVSNVSRNKIGLISANVGASSIVHGIMIGGGTTVNVNNNIIGDLSAQNATAASAVRGINVFSGTSPKIYFNTIHLTGTTLGGSSGIDLGASPTSIDIRNNIVSNEMTAGTGKFAVAIRTAAVTQTNYATGSNTNLFSIGSGATNAIFTNGTNSYTTMLDFQAAVAPRESFSNLESVASILSSTTFGDAAYLHLTNGAATTAESGAAAIAGISTDFDGDARSSTPDIGADEFAGTSVVPAITGLATNLQGNQCVPVGRDVTATVVSPTTITSVTLNYSFNGVAQTPIAMVNSANNDWTASIPVASPSNGTVTWNVVASNGAYSTQQIGQSYGDDPNNGLNLSLYANTSAATVCEGAAVNLTTSLSNLPANMMPSGYSVPSVSSPTTDEDFGGIVITQGSTTVLSNTSTGGSLVGTIGTATGTAGSYSDFTSFGPYAMSASNPYNFSLTSITQGGSYGNSMAIFIDYNRNGSFGDAGEAVYLPTTTVTGPHVETGSFTIPATAFNGLTRMRVVCLETTITGTASTSAWGEYEDYKVLISGGQSGGGNSMPAITAYSWSSGQTTAVAAINPTSTNAYTCTATINGCPVVSTPVTVNVNANPAAPQDISVSPLCATNAVYTVSSAVVNPTYKWYATPTSAPVVGASTASYTQIAANGNGATNNYYATVTDANGCTSPQVMCAVVLNTPATITVSTAQQICIGQDATVSVSSQNASYTYLWSTGATTASIVVSPSATTTYTVTATDTTGAATCVATASTSVTVNPLPLISSVTATPSAVCAGSNVELVAASYMTGPQTAPTGYCTGTPSTTTLADEQIFGVTFGSMSNIQAETCTSNYTNYASTVPTVTYTAGTAYPFSVLTDECDGPTYFSSGLSIFIDYNRDGDFDDAGEQAYTTTATTVSPNTRSGSITIPSTAAVGVTRMRVVVHENVASPVACPTFSYGEMEDYNINIQGLTNAPLNFTWNTTPVVTSSNPGASLAATVLAENNTAAPITTSYIVSATNATTGCQNQDTVSFVVNPVPTTPTVSGVANICGQGIPTATVASSSTNGVGNGLMSWYNAATGGTLLQGPATTGVGYNTYNTAISATSTFYVVEGGAFGCNSAPVSFTVQVDPTAAVAVSATDTTVCAAISVTLTATSTNANYSYTWSNNLGTGASIVVAPTVTTTYTVTAMDTISSSPTFGCSSVQTFTVNVYTPPTISVSSATATLCEGSVQQLTATTGAVWSPLTGLYADAAATTAALGTEAAVYAKPLVSTVYTATVTDINGCTNTATSTITVNPNPVVELSTSANNVCGGTSVTLTATGANTYTWMPGNLSGSSIIVSPSDTTTYAVSGFTGACSANASLTINVLATPAQPIVTAAGTTSICTGSSVQLSTTSTEGLQWYLDGSAIAGATSSTYAATLAGAYTVTSTAASGCTGPVSAATTVVVNAIPTIVASTNAANNTVCKEALVTLTASGAPTLSWNNGVSGGIPFAALATTTYTVTGTTLAGCSATASVTVVVNPLPDLIVSGTTTVCSGATTVLTASGDADAYVWNPGNSTGALASVSPTVTTAYTVTATISATGCQSQETVTVTVTQPTTPTFTQVAAICSGASLSALPSTSNNGIDGTWSPALNNTATTTYTFTPAAGSCANTATMDIVVNTLPTVVASASASSINLGSSVDLTASGANTYAWDNSSTSAVITVSPLATTTYQVTGTSLEGCTATGSVTVTVNACPTVEVSASAATICEGSSTVLTATGADTYVWNNGSTGSSITVNPTTTTTYIVSGTANGCTINDTVEIVVNQLAVPMFTQVAAICSGAALTALPTTSNNGIDGVWSPALDNTTTTTYTFTPAAGSCANTATMQIVVNSLPTIAVVASPEFICSGSSSTLSATGAVSYVWSTSSTTSSIIVSPTSTTTYSVV